MAVLVGLGFASGLPNVFVNDTIAAWLSDLGVDVKAIGLFALIALPYTFKFLWAPLLDRFSVPLLGRRRGWLILIQSALALTLAAFALLGPANASSSLMPLAWLGVALVFLSASLDIVADAYRVDVLERHEFGAGAAVFVSGYRIAAISTGAGVLVLAEKLGWRSAIACVSAVMTLLAIAMAFAPEPRRLTGGGPPQTLAEAVVQPVEQFLRVYGAGIIVIIAFVLLFRLPDQLASRMTMPLLLQHLQFTAEEVGWIRQALGFVITIIGALAGGTIAARIGLMRALILFGALQAISNGGFLVLAASPPSLALMAGVIAIENFCNGLVAAGFVAFLMRLCDPRYSATQYALLTSLMAIALALAGACTGYLVEKVGYVSFFAISIAAGLPGLGLLPLLMRAQRAADARNT